MTELLINKIKEKVALREGDAEIILKQFSRKKIKRKQFLSQEGESCNRIAFVDSGALFAYSTGKSFSLPMCTVGIWKDGVMQEEYLFWDNQTYMQQIGLGK